MRLPPIIRRLLIWGVPAGILVSIAVPPGAYPDAAPVVSLAITDRAGAVLYESRPDGLAAPVRLGDVPAEVIDAVVSIEDTRFRHHPGVDPIALTRAVLDNLRAGRVVSGASTLTMQVARMRRASSRRGLAQKLEEMHLALRLELWNGKDAVLEEWLTRAYFGRGAHGLSAASQAWFGKSVADLTLAEGSFLAGLPQRPARSVPEALVRRRAVLDAMVRTGRLESGVAGAAEGLALDVLPDAASPRLAAHLSAALVSGRADPADASALRDDRARRWREIRTTLDADLQARVEALARGHLAGLEDRHLGQVAAIVIENAAGAVRAYVGSADPADLRTEGANDGVTMRRQPGSALKPFTYGAAIDEGRLTAATVLADVETPFVEAGASFTAHNYDRTYHGPVPARTALASSYNVPALRVAQRLGVAHLLDRLHAAGFASLDRPSEFYGIGLTLGNGEVQLLELARAYAGLARGGVLPDVHSEAYRVDVAGDTLFRTPRGQPKRFLDSGAAWIVTDMLFDPEAREPAFGRGGPLEFLFPAAAKTGTSRDYRDNWAIGYTPRYTVAVWAGNFDGTPMRSVGGVTGAGALMNAVVRDLGDGGPFLRPAGVQTARICPASGKRPGPWCPAPRSEWFLQGTLPDGDCDVHRHLEIDLRTGDLADEQTPQPARESRTYAVYPAEYRTWMADRNLPLPPAHGAPPIAVPRIDYPADGMHFQMDPVLRPEYQRIRLRAAIPPGLAGHAWTVDGAVLPGLFEDATWTLQSGSHVFGVQTLDAAGRVISGIPVRIRVLGIAPTPP